LESMALASNCCLRLRYLAVSSKLPEVRSLPLSSEGRKGHLTPGFWNEPASVHDPIGPQLAKTKAIEAN
jgi:hypothetical protein